MTVTDTESDAPSSTLEGGGDLERIRVPHPIRLRVWRNALLLVIGILHALL